ncbi:unnamed protein product, partial [Symbiodinium pilosum]
GKEAVPSVEGIRELVPAMCKGFLEKAMSLDRVKAGQELPAKDQKVATGVISLIYKDDEKKILLQILDF